MLLIIARSVTTLLATGILALLTTYQATQNWNGALVAAGVSVASAYLHLQTPKPADAVKKGSSDAST